jgi:peptide-methionine (R)-S-oxide reductase
MSVRSKPALGFALWALAGCTIPVTPPQPAPPLLRWGPPVRVVRYDASGRLYGPKLLATPVGNAAYWRGILSPRAYAVLREGATEPAFSSQLAKPAPAGVYQCRGCGLEVFAAATQFESNTGWPSFFEPIDERNIRVEWDLSWGMRRRAVLCSLCGGHLGHVFADGPPPTYKRYCLNGAALRLRPQPER